MDDVMPYIISREAIATFRVQHQENAGIYKNTPIGEAELNKLIAYVNQEE